MSCLYVEGNWSCYSVKNINLFYITCSSSFINTYKKHTILHCLSSWKYPKHAVYQEFLITTFVHGKHSTIKKKILCHQWKKSNISRDYKRNVPWTSVLSSFTAGSQRNFSSDFRMWMPTVGLRPNWRWSRTRMLTGGMYNSSLGNICKTVYKTKVTTVRFEYTCLKDFIQWLNGFYVIFGHLSTS